MGVPALQKDSRPAVDELRLQTGAALMEWLLVAFALALWIAWEVSQDDDGPDGW